MNFASLIYFGGVALVFSYDDLSYNKDASQSKTSLGQHFSAENAVDRNEVTCMRTPDVGRSSVSKTVWWKVDLGGMCSIYSINTVFRNYDNLEARQRGRFAGFSIYVSNTGDIQGSTLCYKDGPELPPLNFTTTCLKHGRYVIFYNERLDGVNYPAGYELTNAFTELCEVIVQGCQKTGAYGRNCDIPCPINCKDNICHIQLGHCVSCNPGWTGTSCNTKCAEGWYGLNCSQQCKWHCRDNKTCNHVTGNCDVGCEDGWYGIYCSKPCEGHCRGGATCNHVTGQCDVLGCDAGWTGYLCNKECEIGTYGYDCVENCSGHCLNGTPCDIQTGLCDGGCMAGYVNGDCGTRCPLGEFGMDCKERCNGHCTNNETCDHVNGLCRNGCQDGYIGKYCNNSCQEGFYGKDCSMVCHPNCKTCRNTDGFCTCEAGWIGPSCTLECVWSYGGDCQYPCSRQCINQTCDRFNGSCLLGYSNEYMYCESGVQHSPVTQTISIAGFSVSLVINIMVTIALLLRRRQKYQKRRNTQTCSRVTPNTEHTDTKDDDPHYQELQERKNENNYQNLTRQ